jgi:Arc/MetJ family transcription regulator
MRTTVDLPDDLLRAAKSRAAERGESLKDFFARAVAQELGLRAGRRGAGRVSLPLVGHASRPTVSVTNVDIEEALAAEDAGRYDSR